MLDRAEMAVPTPTPGKRSIGRLLLLMGSLVALVILLLTMFLSFRLSSEEAILEDMSEVIQAVSNETVANTESFLAPAERTAEEIAHLFEDGHVAPDSPLTLDEFFFDILRVHESFDGIFVGREDGSFVYVTRSDTGGYTTKEIYFDDRLTRTVRYIDYDETHQAISERFDPSDQYDPRARPWFSLAQQAGLESGVWTSPYVFFSSGLPGVTRAQAAETSTGESLVVGIDIRIDSLSTFMGERRASANGDSFIVDRQLNVVAHPDSSQLALDGQLAKATELDDPPLAFVSQRVETLGSEPILELVRTSVDGTDYHFAMSSLRNNSDWVVAVSAPDEDFLARIRGEQQTSRLISALSGLGSVALLFAGGLVVNSRYRRERDLAERALATAVQRADERDSARAELSRTVEDLARSNADLEEYAYATAHDLRTPLRAIGGYAELLLREVEDEPSSKEIPDYAHRIVEGYERMCVTMDNLLEHARATVHEPPREATPLMPLVYDALSDFEGEISELGATVTVNELPEAAIHPIAMRRIIQNLVSNSLKYRHPTRSPEIVISGERRGTDAVVRVQDNGVGIAAQNHESVFRLFNRLSSDDQGSGVGLALVKKLVVEHGGTIELTSATDEGSTFCITLPADPAKEPGITIR